MSFRFPLLKIVQVCRRNIVFHIVPGQIVVDDGIDLGNRPFFFCFRLCHFDHLKQKFATKRREYAEKRQKNEMTLDYCFLSDSRNIFCSQGSFLFTLII